MNGSYVDEGWTGEDEVFGNMSGGGDFQGVALTQPVYMIIIYCLAYTLVFLAALVGNVMVVAVVCRNSSMHTVTNYFLLNLAIADILVALFCVPVNLLLNLYNAWLLGAVMCKLTPYLQGVSVCASVNTLAAIALDRYFAICRTLDVAISRRKSRLIIGGIWITALGIIVPWLIFYVQVPVPSSSGFVYFCKPVWPHFEGQRFYFIGIIFGCCYTIPLLMITVCYFLIGCKVWRRGTLGAWNRSSEVIQRSKVRVIKMLVVVCLVFAMSWLPMYALQLNAFLHPKETYNSVHLTLFPIAQWLGSSNTCANPIIYCFFSKKFRKGFRDLMTCCLTRKPASHSPETAMTMTTALSLRRNRTIQRYV